VNRNEKTVNDQLLPAGTGPERASISKVSEGPVPAGKKTFPPGDRPDAEVPQRPIRRSFLADYKLQILRQADACTQSGQVGELLRREGLYLYVIMDILSRYVVGWTLAQQESGQLAQRLIRETCVKENIVEGQLTIHADRGTSMTSHTVAQLLATLGVVKSHSRPQVSNDNPFSESQFKTLKYRPEFPMRSGSTLQPRLPNPQRIHCPRYTKFPRSVSQSR
jgi:putative transposase